MIKRKKAKSNVTTDSQAPNVALEASAKLAATYEVTKTVQEVIPEDVTRAKADAWLTLISPITQWAGLKGDELAYKRQLLRLQQEETLTKIAHRAIAKMKARQISPKRVPIKFLVPFLEKASLEDEDSELVELWANLLASAAEEYNPHYIHFANIISEMSAQQAQVFTNIIGTHDASELGFALDNLLLTRFLHNFMEDYLTNELRALPEEPTSLRTMWKFVNDALNIVGTEVEHVEIEDAITKSSRSLDDLDSYCRAGIISVSKYKDELEIDFAILDATQLVRRVDTGYFHVSKRWKIKVMFYYLTPLGIEFAKACGIVR